MLVLLDLSCVLDLSVSSVVLRYCTNVYSMAVEDKLGKNTHKRTHEEPFKAPLLFPIKSQKHITNLFKSRIWLTYYSWGDGIFF